MRRKYLFISLTILGLIAGLFLSAHSFVGMNESTEGVVLCEFKGFPTGYNADGNCTVVDLGMPREIRIIVHITGTSGTTPTNVVKLQEAFTNLTTTTWTDVIGGNLSSTSNGYYVASKGTIHKVISVRKRYFRVNMDLSGTSPKYFMGVTGVAGRYEKLPTP